MTQESEPTRRPRSLDIPQQRVQGSHKGDVYLRRELSRRPRDPLSEALHKGQEVLTHHLPFKRS